MRRSSLMPMPGMCRTASFLSLTTSAAEARSCSSGTFEKPYWNDEPPRPSPCDTSMTGTPASTSPLTTARTCSGVNWCAMAWLPSRSVVSQTRGGRCSGIGRYLLAALGEQVLGELLAHLHRRRGHDVQVAGVGRQVVA